MSDMKCPVCGEKLVYWGATGALLKCPKCLFGWGTEELWQALINERQHATDCQDLFIEAIAQKLEIETELERTRKEFKTAVNGLLAVWRATGHTTKQGSIAYNVLCDLNIKPLDRIKALEQKDVK